LDSEGQKWILREDILRNIHLWKQFLQARVYREIWKGSKVYEGLTNKITGALMYERNRR